MAKDELLKLRVSSELLESLKDRTDNMSGYLRALIRADLNENPQLRDVPRTPYFYYATLKEVIDGDTLRLDLDAGFEITLTAIVRLAGVNSPEISTRKGKRVQQYIQKKLARSSLIVETQKREKYGRYLAYVYYHRKYTDFQGILEFGSQLNQELVDGGLAVRYDL